MIFVIKCFYVIYLMIMGFIGIDLNYKTIVNYYLIKLKEIGIKWEILRYEGGK